MEDDEDLSVEDEFFNRGKPLADRKLRKRGKKAGGIRRTHISFQEGWEHCLYIRIPEHFRSEHSGLSISLSPVLVEEGRRLHSFEIVRQWDLVHDIREREWY